MSRPHHHPETWGSKGHLRNYFCDQIGSLFNYGAECVVRKDGRIFREGKPLAMAKYFEGIEEPLFAWVHPEMKSWLNKATDRKVPPGFGLSLSKFGVPCLLVSAGEITLELQTLLTQMVENMGHPTQGVRFTNNAPYWIEVEFWEPAYAPGFISYLNQEYVAPDTVPPKENRGYPAAWEGKQIFYVIGEDTYVVDVKVKQETRLLGSVEITDGRLTMFRYDPEGAVNFIEAVASLPRKIEKTE